MINVKCFYRILDIYGMSESSGPHSVNTPSEQGVGSAGQSLKGCKTKIDIDINRLVMLSFLSFFAKPNM